MSSEKTIIEDNEKTTPSTMEPLKTLDSSCDNNARDKITDGTSVVHRGHLAQRARQSRAAQKNDVPPKHTSVWCFECLQTYLTAGFDSEHHSSPTCNCRRATTTTTPTKNPRSKKRAERKLNLLSSLEELDDSRDFSGDTMYEVECTPTKENKEVLISDANPSTTSPPGVQSKGFSNSIEYCLGCKEPIDGLDMLTHMTHCEKISMDDLADCCFSIRTPEKKYKSPPGDDQSSKQGSPETASHGFPSSPRFSEESRMVEPDSKSTEGNRTPFKAAKSCMQRMMHQARRRLFHHPPKR